MKVLTDVNKKYTSGIDALEEQGYEFVGTVQMLRNLKTVNRYLFRKNDTLYYYLGMDHYNSTVYSCTIKPLGTLVGNYSVAYIKH